MNDIIPYSENNLRSLNRVIGQDELEAFYLMCSFHIDKLQPIRDELGWKLRNNIQLIYAPDFQEFYVYMHPYADSSRASILSRYFLDNNTEPLLLLDGTIYELVQYLQKTQRDLELGIEVLPSFEGFEDPELFIKRISPFFSDSRDIFIEPEENCRDISPSRKLFWALSERSSSIGRLATLFKNTNFLTMDEISPEWEGSVIDQEAFTTSKRILDILRDGKIDQNFADALNIGEVIWITDNEEQNVNSRAYLVTHTPSLLNPKIWVRDKQAMDLGLQSNVLKTPLEVFYSTVIAKHNRGSTLGQIQFINNAIDKCYKVQETLSDLPNFNMPRVEPSQSDADGFWTLDTFEKLKLGESLEQFTNYYGEPVFRTIEEYLAIDARTDITKSEIYNDFTPISEQEAHQLHKEIETTRGLIKYILRLCKDKASTRPVSHFEHESGGINYTALNIFNVEKQESKNEKTKTERLKVLTEDKVLIFGLETHINGFYSFYWTTLNTYKEFVTAISDFVSSIYSNNIPEGCFRDVVIGTNKQRIRLAYESNLNITAHTKDFSEDEIVIFLRINTEIGDFYIDLLGEKSDKGSIMGLITHMRFGKKLSSLFIDNTKNFFWPKLIEVEFDNRLSNFPNFNVQ